MSSPTSELSLGVLWEGGEGHETKAGPEAEDGRVTEEGREDRAEGAGEEEVGVDDVVDIVGTVEDGGLLEAGLGRGTGSGDGGVDSNLTTLSSSDFLGAMLRSVRNIRCS